MGHSAGMLARAETTGTQYSGYGGVCDGGGSGSNGGGGSGCESSTKGRVGVLRGVLVEA